MVHPGGLASQQCTACSCSSSSSFTVFDSKKMLDTLRLLCLLVTRAAAWLHVKPRGMTVRSLSCSTYCTAQPYLSLQLQSHNHRSITPNHNVWNDSLSTSITLLNPTSYRMNFCLLSSTAGCCTCCCQQQQRQPQQHQQHQQLMECSRWPLQERSNSQPCVN
jgi:hypothetical protein